MMVLGSSSRGSLVFGFGVKLYFLTMLAKPNLASIKANLIPIQPLGPCPKGRYAYLAKKYEINVFKISYTPTLYSFILTDFFVL